MNNQLAIFGGSKVIEGKFIPYNSIGTEEINAATEVLKSGVLSRFVGAWDKDFFGGEKVNEFERACENYFNVKHAITVNSWTSGLIAALGSLNIEPGDEIIVTPWTMCATATSILHWNAIPVFADIDKKTFNIDVESIKKNITKYTKAIVIADIFGQSCDIDLIMDLAEKNNLKVVTDCAQAPGALYKNKFAGTLSHVGGFSLNYHKHIHTGEGGILVTNDDELAERMSLIRNHGEAVVGKKNLKNISNIIGHNFRLGEIESAIGIEQLKKLDFFIKSRQAAAERLTLGLKDLKGLFTPYVSNFNTHVYYVYPIVLDIDILNIERHKIVEALIAEGLDIAEGYQNIHLLPMYQQKIAYGSKGFPWTSDICKRDIDYKKGICPNAEELNDKSFLMIEMCKYQLNDIEVDLIIEVFHKVWKHIDCLRS